MVINEVKIFRITKHSISTASNFFEISGTGSCCEIAGCPGIACDDTTCEPRGIMIKSSRIMFVSLERG